MIAAARQPTHSFLSAAHSGFEVGAGLPTFGASGGASLTSSGSFAFRKSPFESMGAGLPGSNGLPSWAGGNQPASNSLPSWAGGQPGGDSNSEQFRKCTSPPLHASKIRRRGCYDCWSCDCWIRSENNTNRKQRRPLIEAPDPVAVCRRVLRGPHGVVRSVRAAGHQRRLRQHVQHGAPAEPGHGHQPTAVCGTRRPPLPARAQGELRYNLAVHHDIAVQLSMGRLPPAGRTDPSSWVAQRELQCSVHVLVSGRSCCLSTRTGKAIGELTRRLVGASAGWRRCLRVCNMTCLMAHSKLPLRLHRTS